MTQDDHSSSALPVGRVIAPLEGLSAPARKRMEGRFVALEPVDSERHASALFHCSHGGAGSEALWTYLPYGPFESEAEMKTWLDGCAAQTDPLFFAVIDLDTGAPIGMASFLSIVPSMRRLEIGHIWYGPAAQRTRANTAANYLMLRESFDELRCRRVEWKCDSLNERSRRAALRLGFSFEGIFRNHLIVKGRNRDTAWYAMTDDDWPDAKRNLERWLGSDDPKLLSLSQLQQNGSNGGGDDVAT